MEHKSRHVVEIGLSLLTKTSLALCYYEHAFKYIVYHINKMPSKIMKSKSPFELLYSKSPTHDYLSHFGCLCYPYLKPYKSTKIHPRSTPCVFLGCSPQHKGYQCMYIIIKHVYISTHVVFHETSFPFLSIISLPFPRSISKTHNSTFVHFIVLPLFKYAYHVLFSMLLQLQLSMIHIHLCLH